MRIRGNILKAKAEEAGVSIERLAAAVERTGLKGDPAVRAVRNWMAGRDHPRCKAVDIRKMAEILGCRAKDVSRFVSKVNYHRGSPRKARLLVDLIRGKDTDSATNLLAFSTKRAALNVKRCLFAAITAAQEEEADVTNLVITESRVDEGPRMKRFQPKDRGRAHPIIKRFSHITIGVEERAQGRRK